MRNKKRELKFKFAKDEDEDLILSYLSTREWEVSYKGVHIGSFRFSRKELKKGKEFALPDGSQLILRCVKRGSIMFWEPSINGKIAYNTLLSQHRYIWGSWVAAAFLLPIAIILGNLDHLEDAVIPIIILIMGVNLICAFLAKIRWKPIAWIVAVFWIADLSFMWVIWISDPQGLPPIMETIGVVIFRDFLVNAKFIWRVLEELTTYVKGD